MDKPGWIRAQMAMRCNVLLPVVITLDYYRSSSSCNTCNFLESNVIVTHRRHVCNIYLHFIYKVLVNSLYTP